MDKQIRELMGQIEAWESAVEFGISEDLWDEYAVRLKSDDLYIAAIAAIFDTLRNENNETKKKELSELAKTLLIFSKSAASSYLKGVEKNLNLLYTSALFYLADYPATATLVAGQVDSEVLLNDAERFLQAFLSRNLADEDELQRLFLQILGADDVLDLSIIIGQLQALERDGLGDDPRLFIASKLAKNCIDRFKDFNIWNVLRENASNFNSTEWRPFLENTDVFPLWELFPSQISAVRCGILGDTNDVYSLQMPTSAGKTSFCEILIYHEVKVRKKRVLFLVPFRALAAEIQEGISKRLTKAGVEVVASYGGNIPTRSETNSVETADVLIVTPEKYAALSQSIPSLQESFETIICDEGHLIDDDGRGLQYELLLTKLKGETADARKIVFISAILPNVDVIHSWLGGEPNKLAVSTYRPVDTDFAFVVPNGPNIWGLDFNTIFEAPRRYSLPKFLTQDDFRYINPITNNLNLTSGYQSYLSLASGSALKARNNGPVALFTTMKGKNGVRGLAEKLLTMIHQKVAVSKKAPVPSVELPKLIEYVSFQFGAEHLLTKILQESIGYHHGSLPQEIRREMEAAIQNGAINILICTSTLAEGVNLPIRTLVVHTIKRYNGKILREIEKRSIKNIVGRVGRAGKETRGRILLANNKERAYVENVFRDLALEPAKGALFKLVSDLNRIVVDNNLTLDNDLFESQAASFLAILDKIDAAIIDLLPAEVVIDEVENLVEKIIERTLAYHYLETDILRDRIKEIFLIRTKALFATVPPEGILTLRKSGSSPRFWRFINEASILDRAEWIELSQVDDQTWLTEIVLRQFDMPTFEKDLNMGVITKVITTWMRGKTYEEIAIESGLEIDEVLEFLCHTIGFTLQDALGKTTQMAIEKLGEEVVSELAENWPSLLQYGLGDLQQLDLFERGASDRLGVWGISRYLKSYGITARGTTLVIHLRTNSSNVVEHLLSDPRVPKISAQRTLKELRLSP